MHYDQPKRTEEPPAVRRIDAFVSTGVIIVAFLLGNIVVHMVGGEGSILWVFWTTVILFVWMAGVGIVTLVKAISR